MDSPDAASPAAKMVEEERRLRESQSTNQEKRGGARDDQELAQPLGIAVGSTKADQVRAEFKRGETNGMSDFVRSARSRDQPW